MSRRPAYRRSRALRLALALPLLTGGLLIPEPQLFGSSRCGGQTPPLCREIEKCYGVGSHYRCSSDFYYFPAAQ